MLRAQLPLRMRAQYLLSGSYFLSGWTVLIYMTFPVVRILTGAQPLAAPAADQFLLHFAPYFGLALSMVALVGAGAYTFRAFALQSATFWIHVQAIGAGAAAAPRQLHGDAQARRRRAPAAGDAARAGRRRACCSAVAVVGLVRHHDPSTMNNVAFALVHLTVLSFGVAPALRSTAAPGGRRAA